jgi:RimJ/RimL family protein N-acetyltransferase
MAYVFGSLVADHILTGTHPDNEESLKLLKRLGLTEIACGEFAITNAEWAALEPA